MGRLAVVTALVAVAVLASTAGAAGQKSFNFALPLPKVGVGAIYEVVLKMQLPPGTTVSGSGNPFAFNMTNGTSLPSNIRAAWVARAKGGGTWDIFVAINALKTTTARRLAGSTALDTNLQATPIGSGSVTAHLTPGDACRAVLAQAAMSSHLSQWVYQVFVGATTKEGHEIVIHTESADPHCK